MFWKVARAAGVVFKAIGVGIEWFCGACAIILCIPIMIVAFVIVQFSSLAGDE